MHSNNPFTLLRNQIVSCTRCPRLIEHCTEIARVRRRAYKSQEYWGKPVPSFGDPAAKLLILGLAPGAHGANRTGRVFTGDSSGDLLYRILHRTGFANRAESNWQGDGLQLNNAYISCSAHCAPPHNKPSREELLNCRPYLARELDLLTHLRVVVVLGRVAFESYLSVLQDRDRSLRRSGLTFGHNLLHPLSPAVITSYHPSQQNTSTGRLTESMLLAVFLRAADMCQAT